MINSKLFKFSVGSNLELRYSVLDSNEALPKVAMSIRLMLDFAKGGIWR